MCTVCTKNITPWNFPNLKIFLQFYLKTSPPQKKNLTSELYTEEDVSFCLWMKIYGRTLLSFSRLAKHALLVKNICMQLHSTSTAFWWSARTWELRTDIKQKQATFSLPRPAWTALQISWWKCTFKVIWKLDITCPTKKYLSVRNSYFHNNVFLLLIKKYVEFLISLIIMDLMKISGDKLIFLNLPSSYCTYKMKQSLIYSYHLIPTNHSNSCSPSALWML